MELVRWSGDLGVYDISCFCFLGGGLFIFCYKKPMGRQIGSVANYLLI